MCRINFFRVLFVFDLLRVYCNQCRYQLKMLSTLLFHKPSASVRRNSLVHRCTLSSQPGDARLRDHGADRNPSSSLSPPIPPFNPHSLSLCLVLSGTNFWRQVKHVYKTRPTETKASSDDVSKWRRRRRRAPLTSSNNMTYCYSWIQLDPSRKALRVSIHYKL